ncbi:A-kinase anchor protein 9 isoform X5 [Tamandua tetradactyla]|uniref:A-kinase anchor protein 9 isoform X5 n=1 Tax=Tamandua tetradactyla TaxID=48850 RepID=UPI004053C1DB
MEDEERQKKLEAGKAKLAQFRQRKAQSDGQNPSKKQKKKRKTSGNKHDVSTHHTLNMDQSQSNEMYVNSSQREGSTMTPESTVMRTLHSEGIIKHDHVFSVEPESEISTTADDYSSEVNGCSFVVKTEKPTSLLREEEFIDNSYSGHGAQCSPTHLELMENELAGKQHEIEELNRELEEMRATYGTEGLQQLQEFEAAIKQRDGIITQLTANLQQARREKDETMREFLELTEQSQKLQIQFQHLQASETLRNSTHSNTAADLLQAKQQILTHQQQLEVQDHLLEDYQKKKEDFKSQIDFLQEKIKAYEMEQDKKVENSNEKEIQEKEVIIEELNSKIINEEKKTLELKNKVTAADKLLEELQDQVIAKNQEIRNMKLELTNSKQKERQSSEEIKQLMGTVEELQKRNHKDSQYETDMVQRMEQETQRKLEQLRAELDEMYGQQIVQMKQELIKQHMSQLDALKTLHKGEMENALRSYPNITVNEDQVKLMNMAINELNIKLQDTNSQKEKLKEELGLISEEKSVLQRKFEDLFEELSFSRDQIQRARQTIAEQESKLSEALKSLSTVEDLKAEIVSASESRKELELKHEAEVTNYKIKLEMLEREKNAVLDRMAESQEAELERLRTQLLFSHEEELSKLKEDLEIEHRMNIEKLKDNLGIHYKQQIDGLQNEMSQKMETMQFEKDNLITKQNQLILEISKLKDLQQSLVNSQSEEMTLQINELQKEIEILRQEEKEKGTLEQEVQELQLKTELLEKQMKEKENDLQEKFTKLEAENNILKDEKKTLEDMLKIYIPVSPEEKLIFIDSIKTKSKDCQKEIEILTKENEHLKKQCFQLNEEIEKQRNTFSFAEKNFEVNYQELQEEYACLLKVKADLEDSKNKQEMEYERKLKALNEELHHLQRINPTVLKTKSSVFDDDKTHIAETFEIGEVVEKDTTELMEKLEVTKREKLELSERLSDLSEQLTQKRGEISFLSEEVKSLKQEKEQVLLRCRELEIIITHNKTENVSMFDVQSSSLKGGVGTVTSRDFKEPVSKIHKGFCEESEVMKEDKIPFENMTSRKESKQEGLVLNHLQSVTNESLLGAAESNENDKLQQELRVLKSEQNDLRLQMEAQRICLSLVYSTYVDQIREYMENEKDKALCSLKEELISSQEGKIKELQKIHQLELQNIKTQETGDDMTPLQILIGKLHKAVSEECSYFSQTLCSILGEHHNTPLKCEVNIEDKESSGVHTSENQEPQLQEYRYDVQDFQENMQTLLNKITEEYNKLLVLHTRLSKVCEMEMNYNKGQQTGGMKLKFAEGNILKEEMEFLSTHSQITDLQDIDFNYKSKLSSLQDIEKIKHLKEQIQELEDLTSSLQQQLKEAENYGAEVHCLQEKLQTTSESTLQSSFSIDSVGITESDVQKTVYPGSCLQQNVDETIEFSGEYGVRQDMIKLLEKQYQERLEEEVAKVIVSMSIAFAQQTELSRISGGKVDMTSSKQAHTLHQQEEQHILNKMKLSQSQIGFQTFEAMDMKCKEEFKPLSKELGEDGKEILLSNDDNLDDILESKDHELTISEEMFSKDKTFIIRESIHDETLISSMDASRQLMLNEEQLEDMRQELVRQYQEHQQATELLRQAHMRQMERQREDQEQLQEEIRRLNRQLAQRSSVDNENLISERERVLLEELEALKQLSLAGREKLCCELRNSSTQTQNGNENQREIEEQTFEEKELDGKPEDVPADILFSESLHGGIWPLRFWLPHWIISMEHSQYGIQTRKTVYALQKANNRLLKILLEVVKTTAAVEETIGRHVLGILDRTSKGQSPASLIWRSEAEAPIKSCVHEEHTGVTDDSIPSYSGCDMPRKESSMWSKVTEEGTELSKRLVRSGFAGTEIDPENEELMLNISSRLQAAVEKLLEAISETSGQLEHAKVTQTELMRESFRQKQEATESLKCQEELQERLHEESRAREQLAVELSKAEGVIDGYADEKTLFVRQIQEKADIIDRLEQELLCAGNRLQELEAERQQIQEERELLTRQKEAMKAEAGPVEQQLLQETEKLMKEKLEVQCQAEKVREDLQKQVKALEIDVEEQISKFIELEQEKNAELMDLRQQNQALEKQLEKMRKFLDEQAIDREHERDVFQQEIQKLEHQLKVVPRFQPINEHQTREVEQLTNHLKEKTDKCSELLLSKEQLQRDIQERNEEIEKLEFRVRELEQALLISADTFQKVEERKQFGAVETKTELSLEVQLQAERDAIDRKEKEITNLEEQLEQFREELENKNEEVQQLHMQLEIQKKESTTRLQELEQENKLFKDEMEKLGFAIKDSDIVSTQDQHRLFGKFAQIIQEKEIEIEQLNEQVTKLQQQLKITMDNKVIDEKNELIRDLETQIECLMSDHERVKQNKEEEIEKLNEVIEKLQQELANIEQKTSVDASSSPEVADSLKHQLDMVMAEKLALEQQVETTNEEMAFTKNILEKTNFKMSQLTQELCSLKKEHENMEKIRSVPGESVSMAVDNLSKDKPELKIVLSKDTLKPLENQTYLKPFEENSKISVSSLETKLLQLESTVNAKELELIQCYKQIKDMQEQGQSETEILKKKIENLQKILEEKVAAALVSQVQLEAVQEYAKFCQDIQIVSSKPERAGIQNVGQLTEKEMESNVAALTLRISELEGQVVEMHTSLILEKEQVEIAEKNVLEKEKKLLELQKLFEDNEKKQGGKEKKRSPQGDFEVLRTATKLFPTNEETIFIGEFKSLRTELGATKEELDSYKEKAENLQEELLEKETNMAFLQKDLSQVRDQLTEAKEKLSYFLEKEDKTEVQENRKVCRLEPLPFNMVKSPASKTDGTLKINSNQTPQILVRNAGIQIDLHSECSSEEANEIVSQFTEKIEQMQELHAAEILDMESRHISETETLKREHYVAIQLLTEECSTLKAVIQCLRTKEGSSIPELTHSDSYQTREICSSDSGSDWGQGIYLTQSQVFDIASEGRGEEAESSTDSFPKKIKGLLRAVHNEGMQVLSLTESPYNGGEDHSVQQVSESWLEERRAYLNTISSLKDLIIKMQVQREAEIYDSSQSQESFSDWRGELLLALQQVFLKEHSVLLAAFQTELTALGTREADGLLNSLEQRIQEQGIEYRLAMEYLQKADRRSLLSEIEALHAQMNDRKMTLKREQENDPPSQEFLEYNIQQKQTQMLEMQVELSSMKDKATELQEQLSSEKMVIAELKSELAQTKLELETTLKAQHKHLKELEAFRLEVKEKTDEVHLLNDTLASEQKKSRELQWALEKEKAKLGRSEGRDKEELEDLKFSLEGQKQRNVQLNLLLEQQKQLLSDSQQKIESQRVLYDAQLSEERDRNLELQVLLESEKVRIQEMRSTLDRERELHAQLQNSDDSGQPRPCLPSEDLLKELQKELEEKHSRIVELLNETEKYKLDSLQTRQQMEKDRQVHRKTLQTEQEANTQGQKKMHELQSKVEDLQRQLEEKRQQVYKLDLEGKRLQGIMQEFQKQELEREEKRESRILYQNLNEPTTWSLTSDRTRNWVLQQKIEGETKESSYPKLIEMTGGRTGYSPELEMIRQRLQCMASKLQHLAQKASNRLQFETADDEDFIWVQENIDGIILQLQKLTGQPGEEPSLVSPNTSCGSLTERLLRQNAELTGYISQLTEEKNDLRNMVMKLEEQIRWYRQTGADRDYSSRFPFSGGTNIEAIIASEKEVWNREKLTLQKSLKRAEAEVCKLKAELRNEALLQNLSSDSEHATLKRIYGKYLRAESFRKALIYQKKYLLLLLGGFQECEDATLALLARMVGQPSFTDLEVITNRPKGFTRFRSAVRVSIAISRMKFLVRRWHRVTGSCSVNINRDGFGLNPGTFWITLGTEKTDPCYHSSGGLELYGEPRHTAYRSRSDLDYPRSPLPFQNRYPGPPSDLNPGSLACSQLQNYDPDRALTDYITRLEALQRRLGTVQSGSATQFHAGMRR